MSWKKQSPFRYLFLDLARRPVLLSGSHRSGTTWIEETINYRHDTRIIFEPLHDGEYARCRPLRGRVYVDRHERRPDWARRLKQIVGGRVRGDWIDTDNQFGRVYRKRLIKTVRMHLMLAWVREQCPGMPIIHVMRHPLATCASQVAQQWGGNDLTALRDPSSGLGKYMEPLAPLMESCTTEWERRVFWWCLQNYVVADTVKPGEALVLFYEDLVMDPDRWVDVLLEHAGVPIEPGVREAMRKPSRMTHPDLAADTRSRLERWRTQLSPEQIDRGQQIVQAMGFGELYDGMTPTPQRTGMPLLTHGRPG